MLRGSHDAGMSNAGRCQGRLMRHRLLVNYEVYI
jgi:hypothetical protein